MIAAQTVLSEIGIKTLRFAYIHFRQLVFDGFDAVETPDDMGQRKGKSMEAYMKKAIIVSLMFLTVGLVVPTAAEARTAATPSAEAAEAQVYGQRRGRHWNRGRVRTVTRTRIVSRRGARYRETYRITYLPNGRIRTQVISRVRIGGYRRY